MVKFKYNNDWRRLILKDRWSIKMAECLINENRIISDKWDYKNGFVLIGISKIYRETNEKKYFDLYEKYYDNLIDENGNIKNCNKENFYNIGNGGLLFTLYNITKKEKYKKAIFSIMEQLKNIPRTKEGVFCYNKESDSIILLDDIYITAPFYAEFIDTFEDEKNYDDVINQFIITYEHLKDSVSGLLYHAWDEKKEQFWCDKKTGLSKNFWGRGIGWFLIALIDVLDIIPDDNDKKEELINILRTTLEAILYFQDETGCWYQVLDQNERNENYLEASCSCMFLYALAKAYSKGYIERNKVWLNAIDMAYNGIIDEFVLITNSNTISLNKICKSVTIGGLENRDGSYAYYISEPVVCNDLKGIGAFIIAMLEYENIKKK